MPSLRALALAAVVALAGCTAAPVADTATTTPEATGTPTPKPLPEPPDGLTRESVTAFVVAHEEALLYNRRIDGNDRVTVGCEVRSANRTGDGYSRAVYAVNESGAYRTER